MSVAALAAWILTVVLGLYMFTVWLIEDDGSTDRTGAPRRLRAPLVFSHAGLALGGLAVWLVYFYVDDDRLAWVSLIVLAAVATLGVIMFRRWVPVHQQASGRPPGRPGAAGQPVAVPSPGGPAGNARVAQLPASLPAERNFPVPIVLLHGVMALITVSLVLLVTLGLGS
jgi:hypothetical protein